MTPLRLGYASRCYNIRRLSYELPMRPHGIRYHRVRRVPFYRLPWAPAYWAHQYRFVGQRELDAVHLFNGVCENNIPWINSFEMEYPRYFGNVERSAFDRAFARMATDECRLLLPMSDAARNHFLSRVPDKYAERITRKVRVFTGGFAVPEAALRSREVYLARENRTFTIGFVGNAFWHKGGPGVFREGIALRSRGSDVRLIVIGDPERLDYLDTVDQDERLEMCADLSAAAWVEWHKRLPNHEVFQKLAVCDVFAFPSLDESLGWVVLEAMALGVPVIASNIFALPELIRNQEGGVIIDVALDSDGRWIGVRAEDGKRRREYEAAMDTVTADIVAAVERLLGNRAALDQMGWTARKHFREHYAPPVAAKALTELLRGAL